MIDLKDCKSKAEYMRKYLHCPVCSDSTRIKIIPQKGKADAIRCMVCVAERERERRRGKPLTPLVRVTTACKRCGEEHSRRSEYCSQSCYKHVWTCEVGHEVISKKNKEYFLRKFSDPAARKEYNARKNAWLKKKLSEDPAYKEAHYKAKRARYAAQDREEKAAARRESYSKNKSKHQEYAKIYRKKNPEEVRAAKQNYRKKHFKVIRAKNKEKYARIKDDPVLYSKMLKEVRGRGAKARENLVDSYILGLLIQQGYDSEVMKIPEVVVTKRAIIEFKRELKKWKEASPNG